MIKYRLGCKDCNNTFDSWFSSSKEFDKLKKMKLINCNSCNSLKIDKSIMSPRILSSTKPQTEKNLNKFIKMKSKIKEFQSFIKKNFKYVGQNFTYEARSIHYGNKKTEKAIYGKASPEQIKELKEEGIETTLIPWVNDKEN